VLAWCVSDVMQGRSVLQRRLEEQARVCECVCDSVCMTPVSQRQREDEERRAREEQQRLEREAAVRVCSRMCCASRHVRHH
jgi:hypothetical protein